MPRARKTPPPPKRPSPKRFRGKLFRTGGSQAVRLPRECRLPGDEVAITLDGDRVILEPVSRNGYSREFIDLFLSGAEPGDALIAERDQPLADERHFEL